MTTAGRNATIYEKVRVHLHPQDLRTADNSLVCGYLEWPPGGALTKQQNLQETGPAIVSFLLLSQ